MRWPEVGRPRQSTIIATVRQSPLSQKTVSTFVLFDEQSKIKHLPSSRKRRRRRRGAAVAVRTEHSVSRRSIFWVHYVSTSTLGHTVSSWRSPTRPLHGVTEWSAAPQIPPLVRSRAAAAAGRKRSAWCCCWRVPTEGTGAGGVSTCPLACFSGDGRWTSSQPVTAPPVPQSPCCAACTQPQAESAPMHGGLLVARPCAGDRRGGAALLFGCGSGDSRRVRRRHDGRRRKSHHTCCAKNGNDHRSSRPGTHTPGALPPPAPPTDGCWPVVQRPAAASRFTHRAGAGGVGG